MLVRLLPWCLTSSDRCVTDLSPSASELNQPEELKLEINSRFQSSNGQTRANLLVATFERLREMPYGPSISSLRNKPEKRKVVSVWIAW